MEWQQWFVLSWMQFALSSLLILLSAHTACRWISQPVERVRLIQLVMVALFAPPFLAAFPLLPFQSHGLRSWIVTAPQESPSPTNFANRIRQNNGQEESSSFIREPVLHRDELKGDLIHSSGFG